MGRWRFPWISALTSGLTLSGFPRMVIPGAGMFPLEDAAVEKVAMNLKVD